MAKSRNSGTVADTSPKAAANESRATGAGTVIIIGGGEDRTGEREILSRVADTAGREKILVATLASSVADEMWREYRKAFTELGVRTVEHLDIPDRNAAFDLGHTTALEDTSLIFFTGGDQIEITTKMGGTELCDMIQSRYHEGMAVAGTSAGASVMSETMLVGPGNGGSNSSLLYRMAPGLGFIRNIIIDQHFAQRGRIGRLLSAVARNPRMLGIGVDEDTAIVVKGPHFEVIGKNSVYVADGRGVTATNLSHEEEPMSMSIYNIKMHVLNSGDCFDLAARVPLGHVPDRDHPSNSDAGPRKEN
jgi:cyanophycinase